MIHYSTIRFSEGVTSPVGSSKVFKLDASPKLELYRDEKADPNTLVARSSAGREVHYAFAKASAAVVDTSKASSKK